jgi:catalase
MHRQALHRGRVAYEPNSLGGGCPFQAGAAGFVSFPEPMEEDKLRGKPEKFADHYTQATLFWESQTDWERMHIANAFRFELSKVQVPAIRERMVASLMNVSRTLAQAVARGLGIELPEPLPKAMPRPVKPEVNASAKLSLTALPGDGSIRTRKVAILIADGVAGAGILALHQRLTDAGAVPSLVAPRLGPVSTSDGTQLEATATMENSPPVLFDALILPDGEEGVGRLAALGHTKEFVVNQYRHCKTILALGASKRLVEEARLPGELPTGGADPGLLVAGDAAEAGDRFIAALGMHRHPERETDPPRI